MKNQISKLLKRIDLFFFDQIDEIKKRNEFTNLTDFISKIDDEYKDYVKLAATAAFIILPFVFTFFLWLHNMGLAKDVEIRKEFITLSSEIINSHKQIGTSSSKIISKNAIDEKSGFNVRLSSILSSAGVDVEKIQVSNFVRENTAGNIIRSEGDFKFKNLTTDELTQLFTSLIVKEKMKVSSIKIAKTPGNLLNGNFRVVHFSKTETR